MMKYPIGIQHFESLRRDGYLYVDKTALIHRLCNDGRYYFLSRPRRFGKSLLLSTIEAYFLGKRELFEGLAIEQLEQEWTQHPVLHLDLNTAAYKFPESLIEILNNALVAWERLYGADPSETTPALRFKGLIERAYRQSGASVVILIDEYDKPLLQSLGNEELQSEYRSTLKAFYSVLKTQDRYIRFALLTGVTKFSKVSIFSDLNNLFDLTMDERYQTLCGITEEELRSYFAESISAMGEHNGMSYDSTLSQLKQRYDGYHFVEYGVGLYNPFSLLTALSTRKFGSYWFETGTPSYLVELLKGADYALPNLTEEQVTADVLGSIDSMSQNPIPVIYQSGYLTIKDYDREFGIYRLGYPNQEVEEGFTKYLLPYYASVQMGEGTFAISRFVRDLRSGEAESFMERMSAMLSDTDYRIVGDTELYFQNAFYLISKMLGFYTDVERCTSNGRMDMTIRTPDYIYIVEFKLDGSASDALEQILTKGYACPFATDGRKVIAIGVNFSLAKRCVEEWQIDQVFQ